MSLVLLLPLISARLPSQALDTSCLNRGQDMLNDTRALKSGGHHGNLADKLRTLVRLGPCERNVVGRFLQAEGASRLSPELAICARDVVREQFGQEL